MATAVTTRYVNADIAIPNHSLNSDPTPRKSKWGVVFSKVLKPKQTDESANIRSLVTTPDYKTSLPPFYNCFSEEVSMIKLLDGLKKMDSDLSTSLEAEHLSRRSDAARQTLNEDSEIIFMEPAPENTTDITAHVDYVRSFIGIYLQSDLLSSSTRISPTDDPHSIISCLHDTQCPEELPIFKRVLVSPNSVIPRHPDGDSPELHNGIPVSHLAKVLDVVVLNFLGSVSEATSPTAVKWALNYFFQLLKELYDALSIHARPGWFGAPPIRSRKRTTTNRPSVTRPILAPPPIIIGTPPSPVHSQSLILDPETGQPSPHGSPSRSPRLAPSSPSNRPHSPLFESRRRSNQDGEESESHLLLGHPQRSH